MTMAPGQTYDLDVPTSHLDGAQTGRSATSIARLDAELKSLLGGARASPNWMAHAFRHFSVLVTSFGDIDDAVGREAAAMRALVHLLDTVVLVDESKIDIEAMAFPFGEKLLDSVDEVQALKDLLLTICKSGAYGDHGRWMLQLIEEMGQPLHEVWVEQGAVDAVGWRKVKEITDRPTVLQPRSDLTSASDTSGPSISSTPSPSRSSTPSPTSTTIIHHDRPAPLFAPSPSPRARQSRDTSPSIYSQMTSESPSRSAPPAGGNERSWSHSQMRYPSVSTLGSFSAQFPASPAPSALTEANDLLTLKRILLCRPHLLNVAIQDEELWELQESVVENYVNSEMDPSSGQYSVGSRVFGDLNDPKVHSAVVNGILRSSSGWSVVESTVLGEGLKFLWKEKRDIDGYSVVEVSRDGHRIYRSDQDQSFFINIHAASLRTALSLPTTFGSMVWHHKKKIGELLHDLLHSFMSDMPLVWIANTLNSFFHRAKHDPKVFSTRDAFATLREVLHVSAGIASTVHDSVTEGMVEAANVLADQAWAAAFKRFADSPKHYLYLLHHLLYDASPFGINKGKPPAGFFGQLGAAVARGVNDRSRLNLEIDIPEEGSARGGGEGDRKGNAKSTAASTSGLPSPMKVKDILQVFTEVKHKSENAPASLLSASTTLKQAEASVTARLNATYGDDSYWSGLMDHLCGIDRTQEPKPFTLPPLVIHSMRLSTVNEEPDLDVKGRTGLVRSLFAKLKISQKAKRR